MIKCNIRQKLFEFYKLKYDSIDIFFNYRYLMIGLLKNKNSIYFFDLLIVFHLSLCSQGYFP